MTRSARHGSRQGAGKPAVEPATQTVLFVGSGDLALRAASALAESARCIGLCRQPEELPGNIQGMAGDYTCSSAFKDLVCLAPDTIVFTLKPVGDSSPEAYRRGFLTPVQHLLGALGDHRPRRLLFISSTRVYTENAGGWVDEHAPVADDDSPGGIIVAAERQLLNAGYPVTILRCAGLYGGSSRRLTARIARGELSPVSPVHYANRVHRDDAGGFIAWLINGEQRGQVPLDCYNLVDNNPAAQHDVDHWLATALSVSVDHDAGSDMRPHPRGHKRVSNQRLRSSGYSLRYPDYRSGYAAVLGLQSGQSATC